MLKPNHFSPWRIRHCSFNVNCNPEKVSTQAVALGSDLRMILQTCNYLQVIKVNEVQQSMCQIMYKVNVCTYVCVVEEVSLSHLLCMLLYFQNQSLSLDFTNGSTVNWS